MTFRFEVLVRPDHGFGGTGIHMYESLVYAYAAEPHRYSILEYAVTLSPSLLAVEFLAGEVPECHYFLISLDTPRIPNELEMAMNRRY